MEIILFCAFGTWVSLAHREVKQAEAGYIMEIILFCASAPAVIYSACNFFATSSVAVFGFAFPPLSFITCPISQPTTFVFPLL